MLPCLALVLTVRKILRHVLVCFEKQDTSRVYLYGGVYQPSILNWAHYICELQECGLESRGPQVFPESPGLPEDFIRRSPPRRAPGNWGKWGFANHRAFYEQDYQRRWYGTLQGPLSPARRSLSWYFSQGPEKLTPRPSMRKIFQQSVQKLKASIQSVPHPGFLGFPGSQKPLFQDLLSRELLLPPRPAPWLARLVQAWFHPLSPEPRPPGRVYVYEHFPWAPLSWCIFLPLMVFGWVLSRRWLRQGPWDLAPLWSQALDLIQHQALWLALLPPLGVLVWNLSLPLRRLGLELGQLRQDHLWSLKIWAYGRADYVRLQHLLQEKVDEWLRSHFLRRSGAWHRYFWAYRFLYNAQWIPRYHWTLAGLELVLTGGRLDCWLAWLPAFGLAYGFCGLWDWLQQSPILEQECYHALLYGPEPRGRLVDGAPLAFWLDYFQSLGIFPEALDGYRPAAGYAERCW